MNSRDRFPIEKAGIKSNVYESITFDERKREGEDRDEKNRKWVSPYPPNHRLKTKIVPTIGLKDYD